MPERRIEQSKISVPISDEGLRKLFESVYEEKEVFTVTNSLPLFSIHPKHDLDEVVEHDPHFD